MVLGKEVMHQHDLVLLKVGQLEQYNCNHNNSTTFAGWLL